MGTDILTSRTHAEMAERLKAIGYTCGLLQVRGYPGAAGDKATVSRSDHLEDAMAAYEVLQKNFDCVDPDRICGFGTSYGGYIMAILAGYAPLRLLGLRAPALYPDEGFSHPMLDVYEDPLLDEWFSVLRRVRDSQALQGISGLEGRLLVISSGVDEQIPHAVVESYLAAGRYAEKCEEWVIFGASHAVHGEFRETFLRMFTAWFVNNYPGPS